MSRDPENQNRRPPKAELIAKIGDQFRINQNRSDVFDEIAEEILGINHTAARCVDIVSRVGRITAGELAREANLTSGGVTAVVDRLERDGYVVRTRDSDDRRRVLIEPAPELMERASEIWGPLQDEWEARASSYTRDELEFILDFLAGSSELMVDHIERVKAMRDSRA